MKRAKKSGVKPEITKIDKNLDKYLERGVI